MAKLNEYIGSVVSSITHARVMSDLETVRVAEEYAKHNLLKHFSVPRMRINDVELTIPVALENITQNTEKSTAINDKDKLEYLAFKAIQQHISHIKPEGQNLKLVQDELNKEISLLDARLRSASSTGSFGEFAKRLMRSVINILEKDPKANKEEIRKLNQAQIQASIEDIIRKETTVIGEKKISGDLNVIAEGHRLKEHNPQHLIYIKVKISEDAMEWNTSENSKGEIESKLIPE